MSGTGQRHLDEHLLEVARNSPLRYRTAEQVRAIPNEFWEQWLGTEPVSVPFAQFAATAEVQTCLKHVLNATKRRMEAPSHRC